VEDERLEVTCGRLTLKNPVGLAAGFDKNCEMITSLARIGFSYLTLGTVTAKRRDGNAKPRMWRYLNESLPYAIGLPNDGMQNIANNIQNVRQSDTSLVLSISGLNVEDFCKCFNKLDTLADGIELNISMPNTIGVRIFQDPAVLTRLLVNIADSRKETAMGENPPMFRRQGKRQSSQPCR
jgi:dihydroorotate dehydrogenase